ncbi:unnamed protein product [Musa acuminata subsp. burmannicoides]
MTRGHVVNFQLKKIEHFMLNSRHRLILLPCSLDSEAFEKFREYKNEVENQTGKSIKTLRSDRGGEYLSTSLLSLKDHGILSQWTPPYTPHQWVDLLEPSSMESVHDEGCV